MNNLSRRCGAPKAAADSTCHSASYPHAAKSLSIPPNVPPQHHLTVGPGHFQPTTHRGLISRMSLANSGQSHRSSRTPRRAPASETGWQGNPPQISDGRLTACPPGNPARARSLPSPSKSATETSRTSRHRRTPGQCRSRNSRCIFVTLHMADTSHACPLEPKV